MSAILSLGFDQLKASQKEDVEKFQAEITQRGLFHFICSPHLFCFTFAPSEEAISKLQKELEDSNELIDQLKSSKRFAVADDSSIQLSPSVQAASKLLKPGMTLTQVCFSFRL
jgi:glutamate/tyrosine decarboxylase-like PLP-dependent enzyme